MEKNIKYNANTLIIVILLSLLSIPSYFLYNKNVKEEKERKKVLLNYDNFLLKENSTSFTGSFDKNNSNIVINKNIIELKQMLLKSKKMIEEYNLSQNEMIISNNNLDKLISLDLIQNDKESKILDNEALDLSLSSSIENEEINEAINRKEQEKVQQEIKITNVNPDDEEKIVNTFTLSTKSKIVSPLPSGENINTNTISSDKNSNQLPTNVINKEVEDEKELFQNQITEIEKIINSIN